MQHTAIKNPKSLSWNSLLIPLGLCLLFVAWRYAIFYFTHPAYFLDDYEEVYRGTVALDLSRGTNLPIWNYRPDNYAGGFYCITILLSFFLKLFGFTMFGLKSFAILHTSLTMMVWYVVLARYVNTRTAVLFAVLYIFAPYRYISLSSLIFGDHAETCLISALTVLVLFRHFDHRSFWSYLALGLLAGFGIWFAYIYGITVLAVLIFLLINNRQEWLHPKALLLTAGGFITGFLFWIAFNFQQNFSGLVVQGAPLWDLFNLRHLWGDFFLVRLFKDPAVAANFRASFYNQILIGYVFLFSAIALATSIRLLSFKNESVWKAWRSPVGLCFIYAVLFILIQQVFDMVGLRFLVPLFPFILVLIAYGLASLKPEFSWIRGLGAGGLFFFAVYSTILRFEPAHAGLFLERKCYSYKTFGLVRSGIKDRIENFYLRDFLNMTTKRRDKTDIIMAYVGQLTLEAPDIEKEILDADRRIPENYRIFFYRFVGFEILSRLQNLNTAMELISPFKERSPEIYAEVSLGMVQSSLFLKSSLDIELLKKALPPDRIDPLANHDGEVFAQSLTPKNWIKWFWDLAEKYRTEKPERRPYYFRGIGRHFFLSWEKEPNYFFIQPDQLDQMPEAVEDYILEGVGLEMFDRHLFDYESPLIRTWNELLLFLPDEDMVSVVDGFKIACERWGVPLEDYFPKDKMRRFEEFYSGKIRKN